MLINPVAIGNLFCLYRMSLLKHLTFALTLLLVLDHSTHGIEVTTCNCDKPIFIGLFDTGEPYFCNNPAYNDSTEIFYEVISRKEPPLQNIGFLCRKWLRQKTIVGYFFGSYDTTYLETPYLLTAHECEKIAVEKTCDGNKLIESGNSASFNSPPTGEGSWMTTKTHTIANCELETFNVSQDCTQCPIKSPFGILNSNSSNNITSFRKGYLTYIWKKPIAPTSHCNYYISRKSRASLYGISNFAVKHIRD